MDYEAFDDKLAEHLADRPDEYREHWAQMFSDETILQIIQDSVAAWGSIDAYLYEEWSEWILNVGRPTPVRVRSN